MCSARRPSCLGALAALIAAWAVVSLAALAPLDRPLAAEQLDGWQIGLAVAGVALYAAAAGGYLALYRRRRSGSHSPSRSRSHCSPRR